MTVYTHFYISRKVRAPTYYNFVIYGVLHSESGGVWGSEGDERKSEM